MNTPSHLIVNLALLGRTDDPRVRRAVTVGALLPDAPMVVFWAWNRLVLGLSNAEIWDSLYFESVFWRGVFDTFNSAPIFGAVLVLGLLRRSRVAVALAASSLVHFAFDLPLHHGDGHRHFFPLSDWIYDSPVSYWDPEHFGTWAALGEAALVLGCSVALWKRTEKRLWKVLLGGVNVLFVGAWLAYYGRRLLGL